MTSHSIASRIAAGAIAGAAGITALNAVTYLDMLARGRGASDVPARLAEKMLELAGIEVGGDDGARENRLEAVGALLGIATGTGVGIVHALSGSATGLPAGVASALTGAVAMAAADVPMAATGVSDPRTWGAKGWLSDIVPHAAYGVVATAVTRAALR